MRATAVARSKLVPARDGMAQPKSVPRPSATALGPDAQYIHRVAATHGTVEGVPGCPGLAIDLDELWAEVDQILAEGGEEVAPDVTK